MGVKIKPDSRDKCELLLVPIFALLFPYDSKICGITTENTGKTLIFDIFLLIIEILKNLSYFQTLIRP